MRSVDVQCDEVVSYQSKRSESDVDGGREVGFARNQGEVLGHTEEESKVRTYNDCLYIWNLLVFLNERMGPKEQGKGRGSVQRSVMRFGRNGKSTSARTSARGKEEFGTRKSWVLTTD